LLAEIDPVVLQTRVDATRAQRRNQHAQLRERESVLTLAELQHQRQKNLMAEEATTAEALKNAVATLRATRAQIDALRAQIDQTESNLRADEANLNYARIFAPIAGTVVSISARQGQTLNTNQQAPVILRIADLSTMTVATQVSEADVSRLRLGMDAYFTTLGSQGRRWSGTLRKIEPTPTVLNNVVLYNALFDVPNANQSLMTQMTAQVFFTVAAARDALLVPMAALANPAAGGSARTAAADSGEGRRRVGTPAAAPDEGGQRRATVSVAMPDGTLQQRPIEIGVTNRVQAQVLSGLEEGERVVSGASLRTTSATGAPRIRPRL
jgi:macrolide-specific efflux system membrane fusion protein